MKKLEKPRDKIALVVPNTIEQADYELANLKKILIQQRRNPKKCLENFDSAFRHLKPMLPRNIPRFSRVIGMMSYLIGIGFIIAAAKKKWSFWDKSSKRKMSHLANKAEKLLGPTFKFR